MYWIYFTKQVGHPKILFPTQCNFIVNFVWYCSRGETRTHIFAYQLQVAILSGWTVTRLYLKFNQPDCLTGRTIMMGVVIEYFDRLTYFLSKSSDKWFQLITHYLFTHKVYCVVVVNFFFASLVNEPYNQSLKSLDTVSTIICTLLPTRQYWYFPAE